MRDMPRIVEIRVDELEADGFGLLKSEEILRYLSGAGYQYLPDEITPSWLKSHQFLQVDLATEKSVSGLEVLRVLLAERGKYEVQLHSVGDEVWVKREQKPPR